MALSRLILCVFDSKLALLPQHIENGTTALVTVFFGAELLRVCVGSTSLQGTPTGCRSAVWGWSLTSGGIMCMVAGRTGWALVQVVTASQGLSRSLPCKLCCL